MAKEAGLGPWSEWIATKARPSLRLEGGAGSASHAGSHLGGDPLLPADFEWPMWHGEPMSFIGQVALADLGPRAEAFGLPRTGWLSFFYDSNQSTWGFDPADAGSSVVRWFSEDQDLQHRRPPRPLPTGAAFSRMDLRFDDEWTIPTFGSIEIAWDETGRGRPVGESGPPIDPDALGQLDERLAGDLRPRHRMLGYPDQIQNEMRTECELVTNGINMGGLLDASDPRVATLEANGDLWQLLLQVDTDERLGTEWGDGGRIYYWIREDALRARAFERAWLIFQCM